MDDRENELKGSYVGRQYVLHLFDAIDRKFFDFFEILKGNSTFSARSSFVY